MNYRYCLFGIFVFVATCVFVRVGYADDSSQQQNAEENTAAEKDDGKLPPVGLSGVELEELESDFEPQVKRLIIPPYYQETSGPLELKVVFPFFFSKERKGEGARTDLGIMPFYWRSRTENGSVDAYFPLYWRKRSTVDGDTDVVLQTYYNRSDKGYNFGVAPLVFLGKNSEEKSSYQVVPPLFWRFTGKDSSFMLAGIFYHVTKKTDYDMGLPPLFFAGRDRFKTYLTVLPPLFWRFTDEIGYKTTSVIPPVFWSTREKGYSFGLMPLLYFMRDEHVDKSLVLPLYYGSRWPHFDEDGNIDGEGRSHYFPPLLSYYRKGPNLLQHGSGPFYHWSYDDGDYLRMLTPLFWMWGNKHTNDKRVLVPPFAYTRRSPVRTDTMLGLVYWNFHEHYRQKSLAIMPLFLHNQSLYEDRWRLWVFPAFDFGQSPTGYHYRFYPLFFAGKEKDASHLVIAPLLWKFKDKDDDDTVLFPFWWNFKDLAHGDTANVVFPFWWDFRDPRREKRTTVAFPLYWDIDRAQQGKRTTVMAPFYWRHKRKNRKMTGVFNVVVHSGEIKKNPFWTFQLFPLLGFGHPPAPEGAYWSVLGGLAGWRRQGGTKQLKILWIPFEWSDN